MPQTIEKYKILIASPSDVRDEREAINEVVNELNDTYCARINIVLECIKWETHSAPGIGTGTSQDIIDNDFGNEFDLFIGILWKRFGTPSGESKSGTEQEFKNVYRRFKEDPKSVQILCYFKTSAPTLLSDIDPDQLKLVNDFKNSLGEKGILFWDYNTIEEFQKFLRMHIPRRLDELKKLSQKEESSEVVENSMVLVEEDELGIFDYQELMEEYFNDSTNSLIRISEATTWVADELNKKTEEINSLNKRNGNASAKVMRDFFIRTADIMNDFAARLTPDVNIFMQRFENGANAFNNLVYLTKTDIGITDNDIEAAEDSLKSLIIGVESSREGMHSLYTSVTSLPRMAKELNRAISNVEEILEDLINKLDVCNSIANEMMKNLR